ncbi:DUF975 family protein [Clostridium massiliamazoniense]|uniref:DUF975 family protein n=1 Tax=Clostridium massiliamazoniense TaxID=1347366 RepID=UPI0006D85BB7|nr:YciC family protein [Clostridium massiliamazoniense]
MVSRRELKSRAKIQLNNNLWVCIGVTLFFILLSGLESFLNIKYPDTAVYTGYNIFIILTSGAFSIGLCRFLINVANKYNPKFTNLFSGFNIYLKTLGLYILISLLTVIGMVLLIIPGIIIAYGLSMAPYILADDNNKGVIEVLKESWAMMKGHKFEYFVLDISFVLWYLLGIITFGLAYIWIIPYVNLTQANYYLELKNNYKKEILE